MKHERIGIMCLGNATSMRARDIDVKSCCLTSRVKLETLFLLFFSSFFGPRERGGGGVCCCLAGCF